MKQLALSLSMISLSLLSVATAQEAPAASKQSQSTSPKSMPSAEQKTQPALPAIPTEYGSSTKPIAPTNDEFDQSLSSLRKELDSLRSIRQETVPTGSGPQDFESAMTTVRQRRLLLDVLQRLATAGPKKGEARQAKKDDKKDDGDEADTQSPIQIGSQVVDGFALGRSLYRSGDFVQAEQVFRSVQPNGSNEWYLKYLIASCLRKQKKIPESVAYYQDVILQSGDSVLVESARWQLSNIRWQQSMDTQLKRLRELQSKPETDTSTDPAVPPGVPAAPANPNAT